MEDMGIFDRSIKDAAQFLKKIIALKSYSGEEEELIGILRDEFLPLSDSTELIEITDNIRQDPLYCDVDSDISYNSRHNLVIKVKGSSKASLIINAHADIVPAPEKMFEAYEEDGTIYGRGACDDKGQIAVIQLLLNAIKKSGKEPLKNLEIHIVVEEEIGGNGTLAMMKKEFDATLAIIMEPTNLKILTGSRGAVWFKALVSGMSGHSGDVKYTKNPLMATVTLMDILQNYHQKIFDLLKGAHPFEDFENPMPLTFGKLHSGQWPATVPKVAVLEGVLGFLPGRTYREVTHEIVKSIESAEKEISAHVDISFPIRRDPSVTSRKISCIKEFAKSVEKAGIKPEYSALPAYCDMWFYNNKKKIPSIIFGVGKLCHAHSENEQVKLSDIRTCAMVIYDAMNRDWK